MTKRENLPDHWPALETAYHLIEAGREENPPPDLIHLTLRSLGEIINQNPPGPSETGPAADSR